MKQGASAAKPPPAAAPKEGGAAPFTSRPYRGARGNSQGRQSGPPAMAAPAGGGSAASASTAAAAVTGPMPPQAARPERFSGAGKGEEEMMGSRIRAVST